MFKDHYKILCARYLTCLFGDMSTLGWMLGQGPLIAIVIAMRWRNMQANDNLYFVIALSCVWLGCINACREISSERAIYQRERLQGLSASAYLSSKATVLLLLGLVELLFFLGVLTHYLRVGVGHVSLLLVVLLSYGAGMSLGLLFSRVCVTSARAVVAVPIAMVPQIVFSSLMLPKGSLHGWAETFSKSMPARWGFEALQHAKSQQQDWGEFFLCLMMLILLSAVFLMITLLHLWFVPEKD